MTRTKVENIPIEQQLGAAKSTGDPVSDACRDIVRELQDCNLFQRFVLAVAFLVMAFGALATAYFCSQSRDLIVNLGAYAVSETLGAFCVLGAVVCAAPKSRFAGWLASSIKKAMTVLFLVAAFLGAAWLFLVRE